MDGGSLKAFEIVPYESWHLRELAKQPSQEHLAGFLDGSEAPEQVAQQGSCWSALSFGRPIACGGYSDLWPGRAEVWATLTDGAKPHAIRLTKAVRRSLDIHPAERIEATVLAAFEPGLRWIKMLGFEEEGLRKRYHQGRDHVAFVLLKPAF
jgi:hypothetical protein